MGRLQGGVARRAAWAFSAQAFSSVTNFILTFSVLAVSSQLEFATFTLGFTSYLLVSQLSRAAADVPILILYSDIQKPTGVQQQHAVGVSVLIGLATAIILVAAGAAVRPQGIQLTVLGGAMPLLLFQQSIRHVAFARAKPHLAAASDALWLAIQVIGIVVAWMQDWATVVVLLAVWACGGAISGLVIGLKLGVLPYFARSLHWLRANFALCRRLVTEFVLNSGSYYLLLYGLAVLASPVQLGHLRAAQTFIGPVIVILLAGHALGIPESVRFRSDVVRLRRLATLLSLGLAVVTLAWGAVVYGLLPFVGPRFFAQTWRPARELIPLLSVFAAAVGASTGPSSGLRALHENSWMLRARAVSGAAALLIGIPATMVWGARGVLLALASTEIGFCISAWRRLSTATPHPGDEDSAFKAYVPQ